MKIHTELFGGAEDGKLIELNSNNIPMEIRIPVIPTIDLSLQDELEYGDPTQPIPSFEELSYKLNSDGKYWIEKKLK
jgi:hypothetical protein